MRSKIEANEYKDYKRQIQLRTNDETVRLTQRGMAGLEKSSVTDESSGAPTDDTHLPQNRQNVITYKHY